MTNATGPDGERLNAYVDGELDPAASADVAAAIAADARLAREAAMLTRLKAVGGEVMRPDADDLPDIGGARLHRGLPAGDRRVAVAAACMLLLVAGLAFALLRPQQSDLETWLARAQDHHQAWIVGEADGQGSPPRNLLVETLGGPTHIPDLSVARLDIAHVVAAAARAPGGLFVGYVGANGCRLGLWIAPAPEGLSPAPSYAGDGGEQRALWRHGGVGYAAIAVGMDKDRFRAVAAHLARITAPPEEGGEMRVAADSSRMTARCVG